MEWYEHPLVPPPPQTSPVLRRAGYLTTLRAWCKQRLSGVSQNKMRKQLIVSTTTMYDVISPRRPAFTGVPAK